MIDFTDSSIEAVLQEKGFIVAHPKGRSMRPFIKEGDTVVIKKFDGSLSVGECVLFTRTDGAKVLHRVVRINGETVLTRGDYEKRFDAPIKISQIIGVLTEFYSGDRLVSVTDEKYIKKYLGWNGKGRSIRLFFYRGSVRAVGFIKRVFSKIFKKKSR